MVAFKDRTTKTPEVLRLVVEHQEARRGTFKKVSDLIKSKERVALHGEVFTPPGLVNDMLDLVINECEREDSRFLEPACGDGNFLAEVLRRRLARVSKKHRTQAQWEAHALLGLACLYGIELLPDNVARCRSRLAHHFYGVYRSRYGNKATAQVERAAEHILERNIVRGDALSMKSADGQPLVLTEWALVGRGKFKRRLYAYEELTPKPHDSASLFTAELIQDEEGKPVFEPLLLRQLPPIHYLDLAKEGFTS